MLLEAVETVLGHFGFDRKVYGIVFGRKIESGGVSLEERRKDAFTMDRRQRMKLTPIREPSNFVSDKI